MISMMPHDAVEFCDEAINQTFIVNGQSIIRCSRIFLRSDALSGP